MIALYYLLIIYVMGNVLLVDSVSQWLELCLLGLALVLMGWYEAHNSQLWQKLNLEKKFWEGAINGKKSKHKRNDRD